TASPSMMVVGSPSTIGNVPLCVGQVALSFTHATGWPSMSVKGDPLTTRPPLEVASPSTTHILVMFSPCPERDRVSVARPRPNPGAPDVSCRSGRDALLDPTTGATSGQPVIWAGEWLGHSPVRVA